MIGYVEADLVAQIKAAIIPLYQTGADGTFAIWDTMNACILTIATLSAMVYFFFSVEHKGLRREDRTRWHLVPHDYIRCFLWVHRDGSYCVARAAIGIPLSVIGCISFNKLTLVGSLFGFLFI